MLGIKELILKNIKKDQYQKYIDIIPELKSEKNEKLVMIILTAIAIIILGIFAIQPTISTILSLQKQLEDSRLYESKLSEKIDNLSKLDQEYSKIKDDLPLILDAVPQKSEIATLSALLQAISISSKTKLTSLGIQKVELSKQVIKSKPFSIFEYNLGAEGNYSDLISILESSMNFQRILTINNVTIVKTIAENSIKLQLNINGHSYFKH
jgi:Tfp pilus assembly protein PilO